MGFPGGSDGKESVFNAGDLGSIPVLGRSPGEGNGNPLQYSCLETPMDRGAWWATVYGVTKSDTTIHACTVALRLPGGLGLNPPEHSGGGLVAKSCLTLFDLMARSTPGLPVQHQLPDFAQTHIHRVSDFIQPSHPLSLSSPPAFCLPQHQGLFQ